jgi:hypothetical protein
MECQKVPPKRRWITADTQVFGGTTTLGKLADGEDGLAPERLGASYSMYLTHKATLNIASHHIPEFLKKRGIVTSLCCVLVVFCVAALLHYLVERPFLRLRDRRRNHVAPLSAVEVVRAAREPGVHGSSNT